MERSTVNLIARILQSLAEPIVRLIYLLSRLWRIRHLAFRPPNFNLNADIYRILGAGGAYGTPDVQSVCCLSMGRRVLQVQGTNVAINFVDVAAEVMCPKLTDIRAKWNGVNQDIVEVPRGSKRFYSVAYVDDVGKGYPNEYRLALCYYLVNGATNLGQAAPVPLP